MRRPARSTKAALRAAAAASAGAVISTLTAAGHAGETRCGAPVRIVVVAGCRSEAVDATALAAALRVELVQEGAFAVDVAPSGSAPVEEPAAVIVRLLPASCHAGADVPGFEIASAATGRTARGALSIADVDRGARTRIAALAIAERLRASWTDWTSAPAPGPCPPAPPAMSPEPAPAPADSRVETARAADSRADSREDSRERPRGSDADVPPVPAHPEPAEIAPRVTVGAAVEARSFFGPSTGAIGPRAFTSLRPSAAPIRIALDVGADWATVHDPLGNVAVTLASGRLEVMAVGGRGAIHLELGPEAELGWTRIRGVPAGSGSRGATASGAFGAVSFVACVLAEVAPHWVGLAAIDVGFAIAGVEARADARPVASTQGVTLGARAGFAYGL